MTDVTIDDSSIITPDALRVRKKRDKPPSDRLMREACHIVPAASSRVEMRTSSQLILYTRLSRMYTCLIKIGPIE